MGGGAVISGLCLGRSFANIEGVSDPYKGYIPVVRKAKITRLVLMPICCRCTIISNYVIQTRAGADAVACITFFGGTGFSMRLYRNCPAYKGIETWQTIG